MYFVNLLFLETKLDDDELDSSPSAFNLPINEYCPFVFSMSIDVAPAGISKNDVNTVCEIKEQMRCLESRKFKMEDVVVPIE